MFKAYCMIKRKPGTTLEEMIDYYESNHVPLALKVVPGYKKYSRNYLRMWKLDGYATDSEPPFDVVTEVWFEDRDAFARAMQHLTDPENAKLIVADEEKVFDRSSITFVEIENHESEPKDFTW